MIIDSKEYSEILITDKTGGLLVYITDKEIKHHNVVKVELVAKEGVANENT